MSSKYLRITEKFTSNLWNNSTPDLWNRGRFENHIDFDLYQCNRNILASQIWLSLLGDGAPILIIHFKNQIPLQMLSYACHSAASQGHPLLGIWKARPQESLRSLFLPLSEFHAAWSPQDLCFFLSSTVAEGTSAPGYGPPMENSTVQYFTGRKYCPPVFSNFFFLPQEYVCVCVCVKSDPEVKYIK